VEGTVSGEEIEETILIMRERARSLGLHGAIVSRLGAAGIRVDLPDAASVTSNAIKALGSTSRLYFFDWESNLLGIQRVVQLPREHLVAFGAMRHASSMALRRRRGSARFLRHQVQHRPLGRPVVLGVAAADPAHRVGILGGGRDADAAQRPAVAPLVVVAAAAELHSPGAERLHAGFLISSSGGHGTVLSMLRNALRASAAA